MKVFIFHATAGYGHQKVAEVIGSAFRERGFSDRDLRVQDALDFTSPFFRALYPAIYFYAVKYLPDIWGWFYETSDKKSVYSYIRGFRSLVNRLEGRRLLAHVFREKPDVILCTHFFSAELLSRAKREGRITAKIVTVVTDFLPHTFCVNEGTDFYWIMSEEGKTELRNRGVPETNIVSGGIPVDPRFNPFGKRLEILRKHGFEDGRLTLLLTSGSFGLGPHAAILNQLDFFADRIQCFVVCGKNNELRHSLDATAFRFPVKIFGFVDFMPELMEASDLMIAKSGGSTTVESLTKGIPMVVLHPIPGQETRNAAILKERNAAFFMQEPAQIKPIVGTILSQPEILDVKRATMRLLARPHAAGDLVNFVLQGRVR